MVMGPSGTEWSNLYSCCTRFCIILFLPHPTWQDKLPYTILVQSYKILIYVNLSHPTLLLLHFFFLINYIFGLDNILERERERGKRRTVRFKSWDMKMGFWFLTITKRSRFVWGLLLLLLFVEFLVFIIQLVFLVIFLLIYEYLFKNIKYDYS